MSFFTVEFRDMMKQQITVNRVTCISILYETNDIIKKHTTFHLLSSEETIEKGT